MTKIANSPVEKNEIDSRNEPILGQLTSPDHEPESKDSFVPVESTYEHPWYTETGGDVLLGILKFAAVPLMIVGGVPACAGTVVPDVPDTNDRTGDDDTIEDTPDTVDVPDVDDTDTDTDDDLDTSDTNTPELNEPPEWSEIPPRGISEGYDGEIALRATDPNGDDLTYTSPFLPDGANLSPSGDFSWTPDYDQAGTYSLIVYASDGEHDIPTSFTITVIDENRVPAFFLTPDQVVGEGARLVFQVTATDPDDDGLIFDIENKPDTAEFDPITGVFEWTPNFEQSGTHSLNFSVSDGRDVSTDTVDVRVFNVNRSPLVEPLRDLTVNEGEELIFNLNATDPDGSTLTYVASGLPSGATLSASGRFQWTPTASQSGVYPMTFYVADDSGFPGVSTDMTITVNNTPQPPVMDTIADQTIDEAETLSFNVSATDIDDDAHTYRAESLPEGARFDPTTRRFEWTPSYRQAGDYSAVFYVSDGVFEVAQVVNITVNNIFDQIIERVNVGPGGVEANGESLINFAVSVPSMSADGRYACFTSRANNLDPRDADTSSLWESEHENQNVFVRDRVAGTTTMAGLYAGGTRQINGDSCSLSADGNKVAFSHSTYGLGTFASVQDRRYGDAAIFPLDAASTNPDHASYTPILDPTGNYAVFTSYATNLVDGDDNDMSDVFVTHIVGSEFPYTIQMASVSSRGASGNNDSGNARTSENAEFIAFQSDAANLVLDDTNNSPDIFVHDRLNGTTERVSVGYDGSESNCYSNMPSITNDGRFVAFESCANNLVPDDTNSRGDIFVRDRFTGETERVSVNSDGVEGNSSSGIIMPSPPAISANGRFVVFQSYADNLVPDDTNEHEDLFVRDRWNGVTKRISVGPGEEECTDDYAQSILPAISADGRFVTFLSSCSNLVPNDTNAHLSEWGSYDVFVVGLEYFFGPIDIAGEVY